MRSLFFLLLFLYPLLSMLWRRSYPLATPEVLLLATAMLLAAVFAAIVFRHVRPVIGGGMAVLLVTLVFVVQFDLMLIGLMACLLVTGVLLWLLRSKFTVFGIPVLAALMLGAWLDSRPTSSVPADLSPPVPGLPPVVHILLDGFAGPAGLPKHPDAAAAEAEVMAFMRDHDFELFTHAYSRHALTRDALDAAFNFDHGALTAGAYELTRRHHRMTDNRLFETMAGAGYRLRVYQTDYLDLCRFGRGVAEACWEYLQPNLQAGRAQRDLATRIQALGYVLLGQSWLLSARVGANDWISDTEVAMYDPGVFDVLEEDLLTGPSGRYFFAHVLLPHAPFVFDRECRPNFDSESWHYWQANKHQYVTDPGDRPRQARIAMYLAQQSCALARLGELFRSMQSAGLLDASIVVLHGDHGPFVSRHRPSVQALERLRPEDYRINHSTLFAVRWPGGNHRVDERVLSLGLLMQLFTAAVPENRPFDWAAKLPEDAQQTGTYVYVPGAFPLHRVDIDLFED